MSIEQPVTEEAKTLYLELAKDPVAFFLRAEKAGKTLELSKVISVLQQFRGRARRVPGDKDKFEIPGLIADFSLQGTVDVDLSRFAHARSQEEEYYIYLFRIIRRLGFSSNDCLQLLLLDVDLEKSTGDFSTLPGLMESAKGKVETMTDLPPVSRTASAPRASTKKAH